MQHTETIDSSALNLVFRNSLDYFCIPGLLAHKIHGDMRKIQDAKQTYIHVHENYIIPQTIWRTNIFF